MDGSRNSSEHVGSSWPQFQCGDVPAGRTGITTRRRSERASGRGTLRSPSAVHFSVILKPVRRHCLDLFLLSLPFGDAGDSREDAAERVSA